MINIKKKKIISLKYLFILVLFLFLIFFFYTAFFYEPNSINKKVSDDQILQDQDKELKKEKEIKKKIDVIDVKNKSVKKIKTKLKDGIYAIVGNNAVTKSDILNEIKKILILNNMQYSNETKQQLQRMAVVSVIENNIKSIEIKKNDFLKYNDKDLIFELNNAAKRINMSLGDLKKICEENELDFSIIENQMINNLLWNSLIFYIYNSRVSINYAEIDEQLKINQDKLEFSEYLISEIVIPPVSKDNIVDHVKKVMQKIDIEGFEKVAINLSVSKSASRGGDIGWLNENQISKTFKPVIINTAVGGISKAIMLKDGIIIFKVRDIRKRKNEINPEQIKEQLINTEKTKILNMYSKSHYENLKRRASIKYLTAIND